MKYLTLLLLVSCSPKPNCQTLEMGKILGSIYAILECTKPIENANTECSKLKQTNGKYYCVRRD